jgi:hypothetical protein
MSAPEPSRQPRPAPNEDAQQGWELTGGHRGQPETLRGGLRDISYRLAIIVTTIAMVAVVTFAHRAARDGRAKRWFETG